MSHRLLLSLVMVVVYDYDVVVVAFVVGVFVVVDHATVKNLFGS